MALELTQAVAQEPRLKRHVFSRFMVLSCLTLGLYSAYLVLASGKSIGELVGVRRPGLIASLALTIITLGIFPGVYVIVLAFDLQRHSLASATSGRQPMLGWFVLLGDIISLAAAFGTGGVAIVFSVVTWSASCWLVFREQNLYVVESA